MNEDKLRAIASRMNYPPTPDIAGSVIRRIRHSTLPRLSSRRRAWSLAILLVLLLNLLLIPPARAAILEFIQIGIVQIFRVKPTPPQAPVEEIPPVIMPVTSTPGSITPSLITLLENVAGEQTLADAQRLAGYPILLPTYPSDLGKPDRVYVQDVEGAMVILVWLDPQQPEQVMLSLHFIPSGSWTVRKVEPTIVQETRVEDQRAIWTEGPYFLMLANGNLEYARLLEGNVLIWEEGDITLRLETGAGLDEAVKIAESLEPIR